MIHTFEKIMASDDTTSTTKTNDLNKKRNEFNDSRKYP